MIDLAPQRRTMEVEGQEEADFRSDLLISKSCENACCRRVAEHASKLMHATAFLKSYILHKHRNQIHLSSQSRPNGTDPVLTRTCADHAALQRHIEEKLSLQREVQQLRKELDFHRETIDNYKQLLSDGNSLREELRNELAQARRSASIARAALEQEKRDRVPQINSQTPGSIDIVSRWFEAYNKENAKLFETIRSLTTKEMELSQIVSRVKAYIKEEVDRLIKSKEQITDSTLFGSWFLGLLGLLHLPCPPALKYKLLSVPSPPPTPLSSRRQPSKRRRRNSLVSKPLQKCPSALESILSELDEACVDVASHVPDEPQRRTHTLSSSSSASSSDFAEASPRPLAREAKRSRRDHDVSPHPPSPKPPDKVVQEDTSQIPSQKSRKLPEIGVCFSLSDQKKPEKHDEGKELMQISSSVLQNGVQLSKKTPHSMTGLAIENVSPPLQTSSVDLDEVEATPIVGDHPLIESGFSSPVLRPSPPAKPHESTNGEFEPEKENSLEKKNVKGGVAERNLTTKRPRPRKTVPPNNLLPADRVQARPSVAETQQKELPSLPTSLAEIITAKFSKAVFDWFNDITTYEVAKALPLEPPQPQVTEPKLVPLPSVEEDKRESTCRKLSIPLGSCVGMESGIVSTPQPQSLLEDLTAHFVGQREFGQLSASSISMEVVCDALIQALELVPGADPGLVPHPPDPVLRAASLLKAMNMPQETSSFTLWFRVCSHAKKKRRRLPRTPLQIFRLAQTAFLVCDSSRRSDLLYQLTTFLSFSEYNSAAISCLLLAFQHVPSTPLSSLDNVYQFLAWEEAEESADIQFISILQKTSCWSSPPTITSLRDLVSNLVDDFCYTRSDNADDTSRALRLILTARAFTNLEVKKSSAYRFGLVGWLLRARLINWINTLTKSIEVDSTLQLMLRVCSLSVDVILLTVQLDLRRPSTTPSNKKLSACQRGVLACCERLFEVLVSLFSTSSQHFPLVVFCLFRLVPCLSDDQITELGELLRGVSMDDLPTPNPIGISSILPPLQSAFVKSSLERLEIPQAQSLAHWIQRTLSLSPPLSST